MRRNLWYPWMEKSRSPCTYRYRKKNWKNQEERNRIKKLTREEQAQKDLAEAVTRYNEQQNDPDYYYLPDKLDGKKIQWESPADTSGMLLTGLFLVAAMAILVMKGREEQVQLQKKV